MRILLAFQFQRASTLSKAQGETIPMECTTNYAQCARRESNARDGIDATIPLDLFYHRPRLGKATMIS